MQNQAFAKAPGQAVPKINGHDANTVSWYLRDLRLFHIIELTSRAEHVKGLL